VCELLFKLPNQSCGPSAGAKRPAVSTPFVFCLPEGSKLLEPRGRHYICTNIVNCACGIVFVQVRIVWVGVRKGESVWREFGVVKTDLPAVYLLVRGLTRACSLRPRERERKIEEEEEGERRKGEDIKFFFLFFFPFRPKATLGWP